MHDDERVEAEVRGLLSALAEEAPEGLPVPAGMIRRARLHRARTATVLAVTAALLGYGAFAGVQALRAVSPPSPRLAVRPPTPARTSLRQSVRLLRVYDLEPDVMIAGSGRLFGIVARSGASVTVVRIDPDGTVARRTLTDPLARYLSRGTATSRALFVGTSVIHRFTSASDELLRLDASTLAVTARVPLPGPVVAMASDAGDVWVALADRILRLDPVSLATIGSRVIPNLTPPPLGSSGIGSLARGPNALWATAGDARHTALYRLDPASLAVLGRTDVPESGQGIGVVGGPESVWLTGEDFARRVGTSGHLSGAIRGPHLQGLQAAAAVGPDLVALSSSGGSPETLVLVGERGSVLARSEVGDAGGRLVADGRDVWLLRGRSVGHWALVQPGG
jgi:hypothetical protein